jgi:hypothetical protein
MKTIKRFLLFGIIVSMAVFTACEKDETEELSYEEGKEALNNLDSQMASDLDMMAESEGMAAIGTLNGMEDPFTSGKSNANTAVIKNIAKFALPIQKQKELKSTASVAFNFDDWVGTYTWDNSVERWDIDWGNPSDQIVIIFPADSTNMADNNATLVIYDYEEVAVTTDGYTEYLPTKLEADLSIDGTKYVDVNMTGQWDDQGEPTSLDMSVFLKPFTFSGQLSSSSSDASIDLAIDYNDEQIFSTGLSATYSGTMEEPDVIDGYIQYRKIKVEANINAGNLNQLFEDLESGESQYDTVEKIEDAINDEIDAKILSDGKKVATIEIRLDEQEGYMVVLVFNDGTEENAEPYFDNFSSNLEDLFDMIGLQLEENFDSMK